MTLEEIILLAIEGKAILFVGAGFNYIKEGGTLNTGNDLKKDLLEECGIKESEEDLMSIADFYIKKFNSKKLIEVLSKKFNVEKVGKAQKDILSINWKRIYTTNYDLMVEEAARENAKQITSIKLSDTFNNDMITNICVHVNGLITNLNEDTLKSEFKLLNTSYDKKLEESKWYNLMKNDFSSARVIIFIGFSFKNDLDLRREISSPLFKAKVFFISKPEMDPIEGNRLRSYGEVLDIGIDGFADKLREVKERYVEPASKKYEYSSFFNQKYEQDFNKIQLDNYLDFYQKGKYNKSFFKKDDTGRYLTIASREKERNIFFKDYYKNIKVYLVLSRLGNGKSIFCDLLYDELIASDYPVFRYIKNTIELDDDIQEICKRTHSSREKKIVIIDDYYKNIDVLAKFSVYGIENIIFILTTRQSQLGTNIYKLIAKLGIRENNIKPIYIDKLTDKDCQDLVSLFKREKLDGKYVSKSNDELIEYINNDCHSEISNIVLDFFDSSSIKKKLKDLINEMNKTDKEIKDIIIISLCNDFMGLNLNITNIIDLLNIDYKRLTIKDNIIAKELFDFDSGELKIASSIISREILYTVINIEDIIDSLIELVDAADRKLDTYREMLKALVSHSNFHYFIDNNKDEKKALIVRKIKMFYDNIRNKTFANENPFYWEQYCLICIYIKDYDTAQYCIEYAISEAKKIEGFEPFQIYTIFAWLILSKSMDNNNIEVLDILKNIEKSCDYLTKYFSNKQNNLHYVFQVSEKMLDLYDKNEYKFGNNEKQKYISMIIPFNKLLVDYKNNEGKNWKDIELLAKKFEENIERAKMRG